MAMAANATCRGKRILLRNFEDQGRESFKRMAAYTRCKCQLSSITLMLWIMTDISASIPVLSSVLNPLPHDQYKITVDINQVIYDGGAIKSARAIEKADLSINQKQTETDLYKLRGQINSYYFNLLLLEQAERASE